MLYCSFVIELISTTSLLYTKIDQFIYIDKLLEHQVSHLGESGKPSRNKEGNKESKEGKEGKENEYRRKGGISEFFLNNRFLN